MKKSLKLLLIVFITFFICNIPKTKLYANNVCQIQADLSSTYAKPGTEIEMSISISNINEAIAGVEFSLDYDSSILEVVKLNNTNNWTITQTENFFTIFTKDYEATTQAEKMASIIFKVKNHEQVNATAVTLSSIQITKDDASVVNLEEIKKELSTNTSGNNNLTTNEKNSNKKNSEDELPKTGEIIGIIGKCIIIVAVVIIIAIIVCKKRKK